MSGTIRTFLAIDIEDQRITRRITQIQGILSNSGAILKLVKPQNIHLTVRFLGNISQQMVNAIYDEMKQVSLVPFDIQLGGLGVFPKLNYPRVVWIGIKKGAYELKNVFEQLEPRLRRLGFKPDTKGFSPHLTIARVKSGKNKAKLAEVILQNENHEFGEMKFDCLKLKKSDLTPRGPIYTTLKEVFMN